LAACIGPPICTPWYPFPAPTRDALPSTPFSCRDADLAKGMRACWQRRKRSDRAGHLRMTSARGR
jgi:hypothetical protein